MAIGLLTLEPKKLFRYPDPKLDTVIFLPKAFREAEADILRLGGSPIYWVVGARGSGKSQLLHYVARQYLSRLDSWKILPIFVEMQGSYGEGVHEANRFRENLSQFLLRALFSLHQNIEADYTVGPITLNVGGPGQVVVVNSLQTYLREYLARGERLMEEWARGQQEGWASRKAEALLTEMIQQRIVKGIVLIVDDFDKYRYETISDCLLKQQAFYSHLVDLGSRMFFTASDQWFRYIADRANSEWNFYQGVAASNYFEVPLVKSIEDAKKLIESRLQATSNGFGGQIPFLPGAYLVLVQESRGVPRPLIEYAQAVLDAVGESELKIGREKALEICRLLEKPPERRYVEKVMEYPPNAYTKLTVHQALWRVAHNERLSSLFRIFYRKPEITYDLQLVVKYLGRETSQQEFERDLQELTDLGLLRQRRVSEDFSAIINELLDDLMLDLDGLFRLVSQLPEVITAAEARPAAVSPRLALLPLTKTETWSQLQTWTYVAWHDSEMQPYLLATTAQLSLEFDYDVLQRYLGRDYDEKGYLMKVGSLARAGLVDGRGPVRECRDVVPLLRDGYAVPRLDSRALIEGLVRLKGVATTEDIAKFFSGPAQKSALARMRSESISGLLDSLVEEGRLLRADWGGDYYLAPCHLLDPRDYQKLAVPQVAAEITNWLYVVSFRLQADRLLGMTQELARRWLAQQARELVATRRLPVPPNTYEEADARAESILAADALKRWAFTRELLQPEPVIKDPGALVASTVETLATIGAEIASERIRQRNIARFVATFAKRGLKEEEIAEVTEIADFLGTQRDRMDLVPVIFDAQAGRPVSFPKADAKFIELMSRRHVLKGATWSHRCGLEVWMSSDAKPGELRHLGCDSKGGMTQGKASFLVRNPTVLETWRKSVAMALMREIEVDATAERLSFIERFGRSYDFVVIAHDRAIGVQVLRSPEERQVFTPTVTCTVFDPHSEGAKEKASTLDCDPTFASLLSATRASFTEPESGQD